VGSKPSPRIATTSVRGAYGGDRSFAECCRRWEDEPVAELERSRRSESGDGGDGRWLDASVRCTTVDEPRGDSRLRRDGGADAGGGGGPGLIALVDMDRDCRASCLASSFWRFSSWAIRAFSAASRSFCAFASALARSLAAFSSALRSAANRFSSSFWAFFSAFSAFCMQSFAGVMRQALSR